MTYEEMLKQLESLRDNSADMARGVDEPGIWHHDVVALEMALDILQEKKDCVMVLPCKVGDTAWVVWDKEVVETTVCCIRPFVLADHTEFRGNALWTLEDPFYSGGRLLTQEIFIVFGEDAFLTREEAERALEGGTGE